MKLVFLKNSMRTITVLYFTFLHNVFALVSLLKFTFTCGAVIAAIRSLECHQQNDEILIQSYCCNPYRFLSVNSCLLCIAILLSSKLC